MPCRPGRFIASSARRRHKLGPHRLGPALGHPRSTVYAVLRREGLSRLSRLDRPTSVPIRYERERPGELVHIDVKKLGKIRPGGGWKLRGRSRDVRATRYGNTVGYDYLHVAIDDHSRYAYVEVHPDERGQTCAGFLIRTAAHLADQGVRIDRVMTDQAKNYTRSHPFAAALVDIGATHVITRPYRPQTNGKAEASTVRCSTNGPTAGSTVRTPRDWQRSLGGSTPTIGNVPTPRSEDAHRSHGCRQRRWELQLGLGES